MRCAPLARRLLWPVVLFTVVVSVIMFVVLMPMLVIVIMLVPIFVMPVILVFMILAVFVPRIRSAAMLLRGPVIMLYPQSRAGGLGGLKV